MKIELTNEVITVEDGTYTAVIENIHAYNEGENILMKLKLDDGRIFVKFYTIQEFSGYLWANVFRALNSDDTDDLIGKTVEIEVKNRISELTETVFSNIKKVKLI